MPETRLKETQPPMSGCFFVVCEPKTLNLTKKGALLPTYLVVLQHSLFVSLSIAFTSQDKPRSIGELIGFDYSC